MGDKRCVQNARAGRLLYTTTTTRALLFRLSQTSRLSQGRLVGTFLSDGGLVGHVLGGY